MAKPWRERPPRGSVVDHPRVRALAAGPDPGIHPRVHHDDGRVFVHYRRTRLYLDRRAWERLEGPEDVLVLRIAVPGEPTFSLAFTRAELERVFGEVRATRSWEQVRCYHFPELPPAAESFRV